MLPFLFLFMQWSFELKCVGGKKRSPFLLFADMNNSLAFNIECVQLCFSDAMLLYDRSGFVIIPSELNGTLNYDSIKINWILRQRFWINPLFEIRSDLFFFCSSLLNAFRTFFECITKKLHVTKTVIIRYMSILNRDTINQSLEGIEFFFVSFLVLFLSLCLSFSCLVKQQAL